MSGASPAPPGLAPMYGAPQTPTPVAVPQVNLRQRGLYIVPPILVTQEECIVTSSYEAAPPARPTYDSGAPQPAAPQPPPQQHHPAPMPGPHQVSFPFFMWCRTSCVELYILLTRCSSHSLSSSSSISKATSSNLCIISREHSTTILLPHNIIRW